MSGVNRLNLSIYKNEWFALENDNMDEHLFRGLVNAIEKIFVEEYKLEGAKDHVNKIEKDGRLVLFINQRKVPNIVKSLVHNPAYEIEIALKGKNNQNEDVSRTIRKPFDANQVTELVPCYNNKNKR